MSDTDAHVPLPDLNAADTPAPDDVAYHDEEHAARWFWWKTSWA